jgi:two-component system chemotaxis sensor kinase CheA
MDMLQFQDIATQQMNHAASMLEDIEEKLNLIVSFVPSTAGELATLETPRKDRAYDPDAEQGEKIDKQRDADSIFRKRDQLTEEDGLTPEVDSEAAEMQAIIDDFIAESTELITGLNADLVELEDSPENDELLNRISRALHTIKGNSSFLDFEQITDVCHATEDLLNPVRKGEQPVSTEIIDAVLRAVDSLQSYLDAVRCEGETALSPESEVLEKRAEISPEPGSPQEPESLFASDPTFRLEVGRIDDLIDLAGELILQRNGLVQLIEKLAKQRDTYTLDRVRHCSETIDRTVTDLQAALMKIRMQPIGVILRRYLRLVRDVARKTGKQIRLNISGEETELDKSVIDEISNPLVHIIRNCCDHGIEEPADRVALGKPAIGQISLSAERKGSKIIIRIADDGRGFDVDSIRREALERGQVSSDQLLKMPDQELFNFIFEPGFSTAHEVTSFSGRGVGMDVVRAMIEKLKGTIELDSQPGLGTAFTIKLPLTQAVMHGLLVEADDDGFLLPLTAVCEAIRSSDPRLVEIDGQPGIRDGAETIPVYDLSRMLLKDNPGDSIGNRKYIVLLALAEKKLGVAVDRCLGDEEAVIRPLGDWLGRREGIAGATVLSDGGIRLVVDVAGLFKMVSNQSLPGPGSDDQTDV